MNPKNNAIRYIGLVLLIIIFIAVSVDAKTKTESFKHLKLQPNLETGQMDALRKLVPEAEVDTHVRRLAPEISKSLLSDPAMVTHQLATYTHVDFADNQLGGQGKWTWKQMVKDSAAEMGQQQREKLLAKIPLDRRQNKVYIEQYLKRKSEQFKKRNALSLQGLIQIELTLAPNPNAAREFMISKMILSMLPVDELIRLYTQTERTEALGDVSYSIASRSNDQVQIRFVRDNIYVEIKSQGTLTSQSLTIARKIDTLILEQPILSDSQILDMKPVITLSKKSKEIFSYALSDIDNQEIVSIYGLANDRRLPAKAGEISVTSRATDVPIRVIAITDRLLVGVDQM